MKIKNLLFITFTNLIGIGGLNAQTYISDHCADAPEHLVTFGCSSPTLISFDPPAYTFTAQPHDTETESCVGSTSTPTSDVWLKFDATAADIKFEMTNITTLPATVVMSIYSVEIYTGPCDALEFVNCVAVNGGMLVGGGISNVVLNLTGLTIDQTYYARIVETSVSAPEMHYDNVTFDLCISTPAPPPMNDECANAIPITSPITEGNNFDATTSSPSLCGGTVDMNIKDVWYSYTAATTGDLNVNISGEAATMRGQYFLDMCPLGLGFDCIMPSATIPMTAGQTVYFKVFGVSGASGPFTISLSGTALPVDLLQFEATTYQNSNNLYWKVANMDRFSHFEVEKSNNASDFKLLGTAKGELNTLEYNMQDADPFENTYYRIKLVDEDGRFKYSNVIQAINRDLSRDNGSISIAPNPVLNHLSINSTQDVDFNVSIVDIFGKIVLEPIKIKGNNKIDVSHLNSGIYFLRYQTGNEINTLKFSKL